MVNLSRWSICQDGQFVKMVNLSRWSICQDILSISPVCQDIHRVCQDIHRICQDIRSRYPVYLSGYMARYDINILVI